MLLLVAAVSLKWQTELGDMIGRSRVVNCFSKATHQELTALCVFCVNLLALILSTFANAYIVACLSL